MEEITEKKLMTDFDAVLTQINDIVANSKSTNPAVKQQAKIDAVTALSQIKGLVEGKTKIAIDDLGSYKGADKDNYDTILHALLDKMTGEVELEKSELTKRKTDLQNEKNTKVTDYKTKNPDWDKDDAKKAELAELEAKYDAEIAVIDGYLKDMATAKVTTLKVDLKKDFADKVGESIFRAHTLRKTLIDRAKNGVDRNEILSIYENGIQNIETRINALNDEKAKIQDKVFAMVMNGTDNEYEKFKNSPADADKIAHMESIRQRAITKANELNAKGDKELLDLLTKEGFENPATPISDIAKAKEFEQKVLFIYRDRKNAIKKEQQELEQDRIVLQQERVLLLKELEAMRLDVNSPEVQAEKDLREKQIRTSMHGDKKFEEEWNQTVLRFCKCRDDENTNNKISYGTTLPSSGANVQIDVKTIDIANYDGGEAQYEQDIQFLNLNEYKKFLELTSAYESISNATQDASDRFILMKELMAQVDPERLMWIEDIESKSSSDQAFAVMNEYLSEGKEYIDSYNGFTNEAGVKYSTLKTAGSTLKDMLPVSGNLPATQKVGNALSNVGRFFGLRMPKFHRIDENGKKVRDIKGGLITLGTDLAVLGGAVATGIVGGPLALAGTYGVAYAAKGAVTAGNLVTARAHYKKHKYEIDNNLPTLGRATPSDKEVARRDYYRQVEGRGAFSSWLRAKNEKNFSIFAKRARATEDRICDRSVKLAHTSINNRITTNRAIAEQNQITRQNNIRITARDAFTYNDLMTRKGAILAKGASDFDTVVKNAALRGRGLAPNFRMANSTKPIGDKYKRTSEAAFGQMEDFRLNADSSSVNAFTVEQKYRAQREHTDRWNRFWTTVLTLGGRMSFDFAKTRFLEQKTVTVKDPDTMTPQKVIPGHDEIQRVAIEKEVPGGDFSKSVSDLSYGDDVYLHTFGAPLHSTSHLAKGTSIDGFAISYVKDGHQYGVSIGESASGFTHEHVQTLLGQGENLSNMPMIDAVKKMISNNPDAWKAYMDAKGIPANTKLEDVLVKAIQDGDVYGQSGVTGWRHLGTNNLITKKVTEYVEKTVHIPEQIIPGKIIPGATRTVTTEAFSARLAGMSALRGAAPGLGVAVGETLHNRGENTNGERHNKPGQMISGRRSGRFEDNNRLLNDDKYIEDDDLIQ